MNKDQDALDTLRYKLKTYIDKNFETIEEFCWENEIAKSTISNFFAKKYDFKVSTIEKVANAMGKKLFIDVR